MYGADGSPSAAHPRRAHRQRRRSANMRAQAYLSFIWRQRKKARVDLRERRWRRAMPNR